MKSITPDRSQQELQQKGGADFAIEYVDGYRFRVAVFKQKGTIGMVLRRIPRQFLTFEQLRTPEVIRQLIVQARVGDFPESWQLAVGERRPRQVRRTR